MFSFRFNIAKFSFFLLLLKTVFAQTKNECLTFKFHGECVAYKQCPFSEKLNGFIHESDLREFRDRTSACSRLGSGFMCCEKVFAASTRPTLATRPTSKVTTRATTRVTVKTSSKLPQKISTTTKSPTKNQGDPLKHSNFRFFKNLKCGAFYVPRIAHGNNSVLFEFPWAAQLGYKKFGDIEFNCGGTVISDFYVLTAAHCLVGLKSSTKLVVVRLGEHDTSTNPDCDYDDPEDPECADPVQDSPVNSFLAHPDFDRANVLNDIGIVRLEVAANFKQRHIKPICLPFTAELQKLPEDFIVIGWGRTESSSRSTILQKAKVPHYESEKCKKKFNELGTKKKVVIESGQFCAGGEGKTDACRGDSGSSIQALGEYEGKQKMILYGIVSYGVATCGISFGFPGIYTKVSPYLTWILDNMH